MPPGAARNAVDCALWDLEAKLAGRASPQRLGLASPQPLTTAYTISLGEPEVMAAQAREYAARALLKVKVGTGDDESRIRAVRAAAPDSTIMLDANEGWPEETLEHHLHISRRNEDRPRRAAAARRQGRNAGRASSRPILVCADESVHHTGDLAKSCATATTRSISSSTRPAA